MAATICVSLLVMVAWTNKYRKGRAIAKTPHRTFEIYTDRNEAIDALTPKNASPLDDSTLAAQTFKELSVSLLEYVVSVEFVGSKSYGPETLSELRADFLQLSQALALNSKVLIDFHGVQAFCPDSINAIAEFCKRLRHKGSRVVLCCISSKVLENFFPSRPPADA